MCLQTCSMSLMYSTNRRDPRIDLCGTPNPFCAMSDSVVGDLVNCLQFVKYDSISSTDVYAHATQTKAVSLGELRGLQYRKLF